MHFLPVHSAIVSRAYLEASVYNEYRDWRLSGRAIPRVCQLEVLRKGARTLLRVAAEGVRLYRGVAARHIVITSVARRNVTRCALYGYYSRHIFLFWLNLGPFGPLGQLQDREG